jgi:hypothetical protein
MATDAEEGGHYDKPGRQKGNISLSHTQLDRKIKQVGSGEELPVYAERKKGVYEKVVLEAWESEDG